MIGKLRSKLDNLGGIDVFMHIARGSFWSFAIKISSAGLSYFMMVAFSRSMTIAEFGKFSLAFSVASVLAALSSLGLQTGVMRWFPEYCSTGRQSIADQVLGWACRMTFGASLLVSFLLLIGLWIDYGDGPIPAYLVAMAALIAPLTVSEFAGNALRSMGSIIFAQLSRDVLWRLAAIGLSMVFVLNGDQMTATFALIFLSVSLFLLIAPQLVILYRQSRRSTPTSPPRTREWLGQLAPMWAISVLYAATLYVDTVIVGHFISTDLAGAYFSASRTAMLVSLPMVASVMVTSPMVSSAYHSGDLAALQRVLRFAAICSFVPTIAFIFVLVAMGETLLMIFDPLYGSAYVALVILVLGQGINSLAGPMSHLLQLTGHGAYNFKVIAISYAVGATAQIILVQTIGIAGAAIGSAGAIIAWNVASWRYATSRLKVDPTILSVFRSRAWERDA